MSNFARSLRSGTSVVALTVAFGFSATAQASGLPSHGHYVAGQGSINKANRSLTVKQSSTTGIIDWKSFSVPMHNGVTFDNGSGATLNRVTGGNLSTIAGSLHATGSLYLINSQGVIVSGAGRVVTGGNFVASTGSITNDAFEDGRLKFRQRGGGDIVNRGSITSGGNVRLSARNVTESGSAVGSKVTLRAANQLDISGKVAARHASGAGGRVRAIAHTIVIGAHGEIDVSASSAGRKGGTISILAKRTATVSGTLEAEGGKHGRGGFVETSGRHVEIADSARISTLASHGATGTWLIDPTDFVIAASGGDITGATLSGMLSTTDELIQSSGGGGGTNGDVIVDDTVSWSSGQTLTLDAYRNIDVNAKISVTGAGNLVLIDADQTQTPGSVGANDGNAAEGDLLFGGGRIAFTDVTSGNDTQLSINGQAYTLENDIADLAAAIAGNASGYYALADNYDASGDNSGSPYTAAPIPTTFTGTFEGLGNTISNLTINDSTNEEVGMFAFVNNGTLRDIGFTNANVTGSAADADVGVLTGQGVTTTIQAVHVSGVVTDNTGSSAAGLFAGDLTGGSIKLSDATGTVTDTGLFASVGGLAGAGSTIESSHAAVTVTGGTGTTVEHVGGLVGIDGGTITQSYATGAVTGGNSSFVGGLAGTDSGGTITQSYATGTITGGAATENYGPAFVGGLVGRVIGGTIETSYATGAVSAGEGSWVGGLAGTAGDSATIESSYATGSVTGGDTAYVGGLVGENDSTVETSFATGNVTDANGYAGGLVGNNSASVTTSYATGSVSTTGAAETGGLVGNNTGSVSYSYATGNVTGTGSNAAVGGVVGYGGGSISYTYATGALSGLGSYIGGISGGGAAPTHSYWDVTTTGQSQSDPSSGEDASTYGLSDADMHDSTKMSDFTFGTTGGGSGWVIVDQDGSLNNASGATGGTTPMLLSEYSTTITSAHQLQLMELDPTANYTLANDIDAGGTAGGDVWGAQGFIAVGGNNASGAFTGTFDGAGHTIANLTIDDTTNLYVGLFGEIGANSVENVGLTGADVTSTRGTASAGAFVGSLVGYSNGGTITQSYATGTVAGGEDADAGGLVGESENGTITQDYAAGTVTAGVGAAVGGLVGDNEGSAITQSYATGAVTSNNGFDVGGLVGYNDGGAITQDYATGAVDGGAGGTYVGGLVGLNYDNGTVETSHATGAVSGGIGVAVGGLVGYNDGTIMQSYATGAVSAGEFSGVGGLVGGNFAAIETSYATGAVTGGANAQIGGLVGENEGSAITQSYATGAVTGGANSYIGGLTGGNVGGTIDESYSIGVVTGGAGATIGGLVGEDTGAVTNSHWDMQTSGITSASQGAGNVANDSGITGLSTSALQGSLASLGFDSSVWGEVANSLPYLQWQFAAGVTPTVVSGNIGTATSGVAVGLYSGGAESALSTYADGSFYDLVASPQGGLAVAHGSSVTFEDDGSNMTGIDLGIAGLTVFTGDASLSALGTAMVAALGDGTSLGTITSVQDVATATGGGVSIKTSGAFDFDQSLNLGSKELTLNGTGDITQSSGAVTAGVLTGMKSSGDLTMNDANQIGALSVLVLGNGDLSLTTGAALSVDEVIGNNVTLTTTGTGNGMSFVSFNIVSGTMTLNSAGGISGSGIDATALTGSANGAVSLTGSITNLGAVTTGGHAFSFSNSGALDVTGTVNAGSGAVSLATDSGNLTIKKTVDGGAVTLTSAGAITESGSGVIDASTLAGTSDGAVALNASNVITDLGAFTTGGNAFSLKDDHDLTTTGTVNTGSGALTLTTTGSGHDIFIKSKLDSKGTMKLISAATIAESGSGLIDAKTLTGSSDGVVKLNGANVITDLGAFSTGGKSFSLTDAHDLTTTGAINVGSGEITLTTTGSGHDIKIGFRLEAGEVKLISAATISESSTGAIEAKTLTGSSVGSVALNASKNAITDLGAFTTGGAFSLTDAHDLTTTGTVNAGSHAITLTTTGKHHDIAIDSKLEGGTVTLASAATVSESSKGITDATKLTGSAHGAVTLNGKNVIADLGAFTTANHAFELTDDHALTVDGAVNAGTGTLDLTTIGKNHNLAIDAAITGGTINLITTGEATESASKGAITAKLLNVTADTGIALTSKHNAIKKLGTDKTKTGPNKVTL